MRKNFRALLSALALIAGAAFLYACGGDDDPEPPTAKFTYTADGRVVTFANASTNATTYAWNFGDGSTSNEKDPVHTYETFGKYTVTLSVTGEGGTVAAPTDEITLAKTSDVAIDGSFTEWSEIATVVESSTDGGTIKKIKVDYDATKIYFYVEGTSNLRGFFDIYVDADNDTTTGYDSPWYPKGFGADFLSEGEFATGEDLADIFKRTSDVQTDWAWDVANAGGTGAIATSELKATSSGKAVEFSILRSAFTSLAAEGFAFAIVDVDGGATGTWAKLGSLPADNELGTRPEAKMVFFDLTK